MNGFRAAASMIFEGEVLEAEAGFTTEKGCSSLEIAQRRATIRLANQLRSRMHKKQPWVWWPNLPKHRQNQLLDHIARSLRWTVLEDGTTTVLNETKASHFVDVLRRESTRFGASA